jgi:hypothetical protein
MSPRLPICRARPYFESLHVPAFEIIAPIIYVATHKWANCGFAQRTFAFHIAALPLRILGEAAQIPRPRDVFVKDLVSDWLSAATALPLAIAFTARDAVSRTMRIAFAMVVAAVLPVPLSLFITASVAYLGSNFEKPFPVSFDSRLGRTLGRTWHATRQMTGDSTGNCEVGKIPPE